MRLGKLFIVILITTAGLAGQDLDPISSWSWDLKGDVKSLDFVRVYVRMNGRNVAEKREPLFRESYNRDGKLVEEVNFFGPSGYSKTYYTYSLGKTTANIHVFDEKDNPVSEPMVPAKHTRWNSETGLCVEYIVREDRDRVARINRFTQICSDGSTRASVVEELDQRDEVYRVTRSDAKGRYWEERHYYDKDGNLTEVTTTVAADGKQLTYTIHLADHRFDSAGNWTRVTATAFRSDKPGELLYQYTETRQITYFPKPVDQRK
jgi:hypothetical protein